MNNYKKNIEPEKCKICNDETKNHFNIKFKAIPICEICATSIFIQQAIWYTKQND